MINKDEAREEGETPTPDAGFLSLSTLKCTTQFRAHCPGRTEPFLSSFYMQLARAELAGPKVQSPTFGTCCCCCCCIWCAGTKVQSPTFGTCCCCCCIWCAVLLLAELKERCRSRTTRTKCMRENDKVRKLKLQVTNWQLATGNFWRWHSGTTIRSRFRLLDDGLALAFIRPFQLQVTKPG